MAKRNNGLFTKVERPLPGTAKDSCYVYGTAGPGVDLGVLIDFEGTLYLGNTAILEAAEAAGFLVNEEGLALEAENAFQALRIEQLEKENADLNEQLNAVGIAMSRAMHKK